MLLALLAASTVSTGSSPITMLAWAHSGAPADETSTPPPPSLGVVNLSALYLTSDNSEATARALQVKEDPPKSNSGEAPASPGQDPKPTTSEPAKPMLEAATWSTGRFSYGIMTGVEFSQENNSFSDTNLFLKFYGDTDWRRDPTALPDSNERHNIHTQISLTFETIPDVSPGEDFTHSEKALTLEGSIDWRVWGWQLDSQVPNKRESAKQGDTLKCRDWLSLGPVFKAGIQTIRETVDATSDLDSVNNYFALGMRIAEQTQTEGQLADPIYRYIDITGGTVENFDGPRLLVEGVMRAHIGDSGKYTWFLGFKANLGEGPDDLRIYIGTDDALAYLNGLFGGIGDLFGGGSSSSDQPSATPQGNGS